VTEPGSRAAGPRHGRVPGASGLEERAIRPGRGGPPRPLAESLTAAIERLGIGPGLEDARLFADWERAVGAEIARVARPHRLDGEALIVHVKHSAWMNELSLRRNEILARINVERRRRKLTQLIFRIEG
jgi:predicted nucleic acid-binding Zn ribbon protein